MTEGPGERNRAILRRTLSAICHLYGAFSVFFGASLLAIPAKGEGLHGSRSVGWISLAHAVLFFAAGTTLWKPRRGALIWTLAAALGSLGLSALDLVADRTQSIVLDGMFAAVALILLPLGRPRA